MEKEGGDPSQDVDQPDDEEVNGNEEETSSPDEGGVDDPESR